MIQISISSDVERLVSHLRDIERKQIPFATATALTAVARHAQATVTADLPSIFDRPTPFTMRALAFSPARKANLTAEVFVRPLQAQYLELEETGGERVPRKGKSLPEPLGIPLNVYGNIPRAKIAELAKKPGYFIGTIKGVYGLWLRPKRGGRRLGGKGTVGALNTTLGFRTGLKLMVRFVLGWSIKPKFEFVEHVTADVHKMLPAAMRAGLDKALR